MDKFTVYYPRCANKELMPVSWGRNGSILTTGVQVSKVQDGSATGATVYISPCNSKAEVTDSCRVVAPFDKATLTTLAKVFQDLADQAP